MIFFKRAVQLKGEDILRHYREDFITKQAAEAPLVREAKRKHTSELRSTLTDWMNQLPPPSKLPYAVKGWLTEEMPRESIYEIFEQPDTTNLFEDALKNQEETQFSGPDYHLPVESNPAFADLLIHLSDHPIVGNLESLKQQSMKLAFDYGMLAEVVSQIISVTSLQQCYKQQLSTLGGYTDIVGAVSASKTATHIIGSMLLCDLFAYAVIEARSKTFSVNFAESLREVRARMAIALAYMTRDSGQISAGLTNLARILWDDRDDSIGVQARVRDLLNRVEQLQQFYDELQEHLQLLVNKDSFPGKCPSCPDYTENNVTGDLVE